MLAAKAQFLDHCSDAGDGLLVWIGKPQADITKGALAVGLQATLVRTGKFRPGDEKRIRQAGDCAADVGEAVAAVLNA